MRPVDGLPSELETEAEKSTQRRNDAKTQKEFCLRLGVSAFALNMAPHDSRRDADDVVVRVLVYQLVVRIHPCLDRRRIDGYLEFTTEGASGIEARRVLQEMTQAGKPVGAVGSGVKVLVKAGLLQVKVGPAKQGMAKSLEDIGPKCPDNSPSCSPIFTAPPSTDGAELARRMLAAVKR